MGFIVEPTSGQLQVPGSFQSYARIMVSLQDNYSGTEVFTADGEPTLGVPDFGFIAWRYDAGGVTRYGNPIAVRLKEQLLASDQPQFEFDRLLVVPRTGVTMSASLRRIAI